MRKSITLAAAVAGALALVAPAADAAAHRPACPGRVVTVREGHRVPCDVRPGQRLDVVLAVPVPGDAGLAAAWDRCLDMGGTFRPVGLRYVCRGVDF